MTPHAFSSWCVKSSRGCPCQSETNQTPPMTLLIRSRTPKHPGYRDRNCERPLPRIAPAKRFKQILAHAAWSLGFATAKRKAFVADGAAVNWTTHQQWFVRSSGSSTSFTLLAYIFAAAMAGKPLSQGWETYVTWIQDIWSGQVERVITALQLRQSELGLPTSDDPAAHPRRVVATTSGYLETHKDRMRYDAYRRDGLPLTSCHVESMIKLYNRRVKGTREYRRRGHEAILQLRSDYLNETEPLRTSGRDAKPRLLGDATSDASREKLLTSPVVHPDVYAEVIHDLISKQELPTSVMPKGVEHLR